jgi:hypothetical protein
MSQQFSTGVRNAMLDSITTTIGASAVIKVFTGSAPANCGTADSGTKLVEFDLASSYSDAAASGSKNMVKSASLPVSATAANTGTAGYYRWYESTATTCHEQGTVTATGGGGDATIDNTSIVSGQTIQITGWTKTAPGA